MTYLHAIIIAILQGISELFPVSSLGHAVLLPRLLHWGIDEKSKQWLAFLVALHLGTAVALLIYFRDEWIGVVQAFVRSVRNGQIGQEEDDRLAWMVIVGTIPAGLVGFVLQNPLRSLFGSPYTAAAFLMVNGVIMFVGERLLQRQAAERAAAAHASARTAAWRRGGTGPAGRRPLPRHHAAQLARRRDCRLCSDRRADPRNLPFGHYHGGRIDRRSHPRGLGALHLSAGHADHRGGRVAGDSTTV